MVDRRKMTDEEAMRMAIEEAIKGAGFVAPNPLVGCVILNKDSELIGVGYHENYGEAHAELNALSSVEEPKELDGASVFVTLEPCAHEGNTPSCAKALAKLPLARVIYGCADPVPGHSGGHQILEEAGIEVTHLKSMEKSCQGIIEIFLHNQKTKRPFVHLKVGSSLDGQIGLVTGESQWITGEESRAYVQALRGETDAVLIGGKTFDFDNPKLNSRDPRFQNKMNSVIVIDWSGSRKMKIENSQLVAMRSREQVFVVTGSDRYESDKFTTLSYGESKLSILGLLEDLYTKGVTSILLEGGGSTISQFLKFKCIDRITVMQALSIVGAGGGTSWTKDLEILDLKNKIQLVDASVLQVGSDICITGVVH